MDFATINEIESPICAFEGCEKPRYRRIPICNGHYQQRAAGKPLTPLRQRMTPREQIEQLTTTNERGCWVFRGTVEKYGTVRVKNRNRQAHRISYELFVGPIPAGYQIDHMCRTRGCVNPGHLQAVTHKQNGENLGLSKVNTSGVRGVCWDRINKKWCASVKHNYRNHWVGRFSTLEEAEEAVIKKRNELHTNNLSDRALTELGALIIPTNP